MKWKPIEIRLKHAVLQYKLNNPDASTREIAKATGVNKTSVCDILREAPEVLAKTDRALRLANSLDNIIDGIAIITEKHVKRIQNKSDESDIPTKDVKALNEIGEMNWKRKQIIEWKPTERIDIEIDKETIHNMTPDQLDELRRKILEQS